MRFLLFVIALLFISCRKEYSCEVCNPIEEPGLANAIIHWTGPVEADGCDWVIQIDSVFYHPNQLDSLFKQNQLNVVIEYHFSNEIYHCGFRSDGLPVIIVDSIRK